MYLSHLPTVSSQSNPDVRGCLASSTIDTCLADKIVKDITLQGYSITEAALPAELAMALYQEIKTSSDFSLAGIGRENSHQQHAATRSDRTLWIEGDSPAEQDWLNWTHSLKVAINRQLFLGLFKFESHFAHYPVGAFYKMHFDAFKGDDNRKLSLIDYLNPAWDESWGGELELELSSQRSIFIYPKFATVVAFLSEDFAHQVLPSTRSRYSVAGWFSVNSKINI
jgi:SM-20-related protein